MLDNVREFWISFLWATRILFLFLIFWLGAVRKCYPADCGNRSRSESICWKVRKEKGQTAHCVIWGDWRKCSRNIPCWLLPPDSSMSTYKNCIAIAVGSLVTEYSYLKHHPNLIINNYTCNYKILLTLCSKIIVNAELNRIWNCLVY